MLLLKLEKSLAVVFFMVATIVLLVLAARGITHPAQALFADELREDPHDLLANLLISLIPQVSRTALVTLAAIAGGYLVLNLIEAIGLWLERLWAEYVVLLETAAFLPYEAYELARRFTLFKLALLVVNALIVGYLAWRRATARRHG